MVQPITYDPLFDFATAYPGMIADSMFTDKVTVANGTAPTPFGALVATVAATGRSVLPIGANPISGIAVHDHNIGGGRTSQDTYVQYDAISVMARGRIWARASGVCTKDAVAKYDAATGVFADAGLATLTNAKFLSGNLTIIGVVAGDASSQIVLVELHNPSI